MAKVFLIILYLAGIVNKWLGEAVVFIFQHKTGVNTLAVLRMILLQTVVNF